MDDVATQLHSAGLKATAARRRVIAMLTVAPRPLSHAEIEDRLEQEDGVRLDRVTLYRVLDALVAAALAMKAVDARGVSRFSASNPQRAHHSHVHFRCTGCGGVFCLKAPPPSAPRLPRGFRLDAIEFDVSGTCADCNRDSDERLSTP